MGAVTSYIKPPKLYEARKDDDHDRPPDKVWIAHTVRYMDPGGWVLWKFYVDFDDPESLVRELRYYDMAGIVIWNYVDGAQIGLGTLYLIDDDDMPTSILEQGNIFSAVYPASYARHVYFFVGGETLRRRVYEHPSFQRLEEEKAAASRKKKMRALDKESGVPEQERAQNCTQEDEI
ncbi:hypothetical protein Dda_4093 [Drechslerella dactyloides]|uniref:Uncharacterized protein n=1 Tax=Drechslerella dactyloides TaxID=74499 RepID=A0AAD6IZ47_DREDA|nr:hypothetical protein Dda_4093 [Drechslerella dactyloides]